MRWLRRAKTPSVLTDYRRVSDAVHSRRAEHERDPAALPSNSAEARRAVRSYRPDQRLRGVRERTLEFAEHSADTPRTFGEDSLLPSMESASAQGASLFAGIVMAANGYVIGTILGIIFYLWDKHAHPLAIGMWPPGSRAFLDSAWGLPLACPCFLQLNPNPLSAESELSRPTDRTRP